MNLELYYLWSVEVFRGLAKRFESPGEAARHFSAHSTDIERAFNMGSDASFVAETLPQLEDPE